MELAKDDFVNYVIDFAEEFYTTNPGRSLANTFISMTDEGELSCIQVGWKDENDKIQMLKNLHKSYKEQGVVIYGYAGESWGSFKAVKEQKLPSECDDKFELLSLAFVAKEGGRTKHLGKGFEIKRNAHGHFEKLEAIEGEFFGTTISQLLEDKPKWDFRGDGGWNPPKT